MRPAAQVSANMRFIPHQGMEESLGIIRKSFLRGAGSTTFLRI